MTPWHSGARMGAEGGAFSGSARGGCRGTRLARFHPRSIDAPACGASCSGTPGSDYVSRLGTRWMPNTFARHVCVVVAASGNNLTLACRIGRKSARPGAGTIALFSIAEQMRRKSCWADLYALWRASRFATHTFRGLTPRQGARRARHSTFDPGLLTPEGTGNQTTRSSTVGTIPLSRKSKVESRKSSRGRGRASLGGL